MDALGYDYYDSGDDYDTGSNLLMSTEEECIMCNRTSSISTIPPSIPLPSHLPPPPSPSSNLLACTVCNAAIYCSVECQLEDEPVHKLLCGTRKQFDQRPHPNARRAIVFEHDTPVVRFAWVDIVDVDGEVVDVEEERGRSLGFAGSRGRDLRLEHHVPNKYDRALLDEYLGYGSCASRDSSSSSGVGSRSSSCTTSRSRASESETNTTIDSNDDSDSKLDLPPPPLSPSPSSSPSLDSEHGGQILCGVNVIRDRELKDFLSIRFRANFVEDTNPSAGGHRSTSRLPTIGPGSTRAPSSSRSPSASHSASASPPPSPFSKPNTAVAHVAPAHGGSVYCGPLVALKHKSPLWEERITDMDMRDLRDLVDYLIYYGMDKRVLYQPGPMMSTSWKNTVNNRLLFGMQGLKEGNGNLVDEYSWSTGGVTIVGELQDLSSSDEFKRALACPGETVLSKAWPSLTKT